MNSTLAISFFLCAYFNGRSKVMVLPLISLIRATSKYFGSSMSTPSSVFTWNFDAFLTVMLRAPALTSAAMTVLPGNGIPLSGCGSSSMVKARKDMSYENPMVGPSEALVSNWKKCGWRLILFDQPVRASSGISFLKITSTQSCTFPRITNGTCFAGFLRTSSSSSCNT
jgi:hypothetical protein